MLGNLGNLGNIGNLMKAAKDMQTRMAKTQEELGKRRFDGDGGGGMVRATVDGRGTLLAIKIEPQAVSDVELLEDLIKSAVGTAVAKSQEAAKEEMAALTGGLSIPGLTDLLSPPPSA